mgnify:CR=1 FL=1
MKKIIFTLLLCILISSCAIYRSKFFEPVNRDDYKWYHTNLFRVGTFENWDIAISFSAYYLSRGYPMNDYFYITIYASTFDKEAYADRDTNYRANIKSLKILYGENLQNEIKIGKPRSSIADKMISLSNEEKLYVSPDIKLVTVVVEMEFLDKDNNSTVKKFIIPMKRKEDSSIGPLLD